MAISKVIIICAASCISDKMQNVKHDMKGQIVCYLTRMESNMPKVEIIM